MNKNEPIEISDDEDDEIEFVRMDKKVFVVPDNLPIAGHS